MQVVTMVLTFLLAVIVSNYVAALMRHKVPLPLLQIALGAALGWGLGFDVPMDPHLFFLLFIPPLLFLDGWRIPKGAFFRDWRPILLLALGLVVFTVIGLGLLVHWLLPAVPLAAAFALAAILSPTDPVAVSAMTAGKPVPSRLMHILEGESLLNDASGLVCFNFAVAAAVTGAFSVGQASMSFLLVAGGGIASGVGVSFVAGYLNRLLVRRVGEDPATQILISLLIPFVAYLLAERLGTSGVLAAVAAGIMMHYGELSGHALPVTRMQRNAVWDTAQTALNGIMFILLGDQLPRIIRHLPDIAAGIDLPSAWYLPACVLAITLALALLRFVWVAASMRIFRRNSTQARSGFRIQALTAAAGVKGAITLAGILTLPLVLADGTAFPARDSLIFLAVGVILMTLLIAWVALPRLAKDLDNQPQQTFGHSESAVRMAAAEAALRRLEELSANEPEAEHQGWAESLAQLIDVYRHRIAEGRRQPGDAVQQIAIDHQLRLHALDAERKKLYQLRREHSIDDDIHRRLQRELDLIETSIGSVRK